MGESFLPGRKGHCEESVRACGGRPGTQQELNPQAGRGRTVEKPQPQQPLSLLTPALVGIPIVPHVWPKFPFLCPDVWPLLREALLNRARGILPSSWHGFSPTPASRCLTSSYSRAWGVPKGEARPGIPHCTQEAGGMGEGKEEKSSPVPLVSYLLWDRGRKRPGSEGPGTELGPRRL